MTLDSKVSGFDMKTSPLFNHSWLPPNPPSHHILITPYRPAAQGRRHPGDLLLHLLPHTLTLLHARQPLQDALRRPGRLESVAWLVGGRHWWLSVRWMIIRPVQPPYGLKPVHGPC